MGKLNKFDGVLKARASYDYQAAEELFEITRSWEYVCRKLNIPKSSVADIKRKQHIKDAPIEWRSSTCHIIGTNMYFQTVRDAGNWIAETSDYMRSLCSNARGRKVQKSIQANEAVEGYFFEYVSKEDYFDIVEDYEIISYAYQKHREIPPQVQK